MLVIKRIAARATSTSFHDTRPAQANPAKIAASDRRSTSVSSRRPASDAKPYARAMPPSIPSSTRSEEHTSELQSHSDLVCRLLLEKKNKAGKDEVTAPVYSYLIYD